MAIPLFFFVKIFYLPALPERSQEVLDGRRWAFLPFFPSLAVPPLEAFWFIMIPRVDPFHHLQKLGPSFFLPWIEDDRTSCRPGP